MSNEPTLATLIEPTPTISESVGLRPRPSDPARAAREVAGVHGGHES
jgi:hypothetical protein